MRPEASGSAAAVLLAGGRSRRMGREKGSLVVGGRELLERAVEATRICDETLLVGGDPVAHAEALRRYGWAGNRDLFRRGQRAIRLVRDQEPDRGPVAGLAAGLSNASEPRCWVLACDLPFAVPEVGRILLAELDAARADTRADTLAAGADADPNVAGLGAGPDRRPIAAVPEIDGRLQPLCAAYESGAGRIASACLAEPDASAHGLLDALTVVRLPEPRFRTAGDPPLTFLNVNDPADLERARRVAQRIEGGESAKDGS